MKRLVEIILVGVLFGAVAAQAERINQEGRILGAAPVVTNSILFNSTNADSVVSAMQIFPVTNPWNEDISRRPVLANSDAMIGQVISDLRSDRRTLRVFFEMNFVLVPDNQPLIPINFFNYPDESDPSPYPIPPNLPIEGWPVAVNYTLTQWQQTNDGSDRHAIIVQPGNGFIWETWETQLVGTQWQASNGAKFNLNTNALRPAGWTSADAAGLPMFPALPRIDECNRGMVEHACRIVVAKSRQEYIYPANHYASSTPASQTNVPAMGQRLRLKSTFAIPSNWTPQEKALLLGLKKYGAIVADNGNFFSISITPDDRWPANAFDDIPSIGITNFEVIQTTGPNEGPRSPGAPAVSAGPDQSELVSQPVPLNGVISYSGTNTLTVNWKLYSGPGSVTFDNPADAATTAHFALPGTYTLMLSAADSMHAVAYDALVVTVSAGIGVAISPAGTSVTLNWSGGTPPFVVEQTSSLHPATWAPAYTSSIPNITLPLTATNTFFRIRGS